jgi:hypothetical protein
MIIQKHVFDDLLEVFDLVQGQNPVSLSKNIDLCDIPLNLKSALIEAVNGDNRLLNAWLFSEGFHQDQCIAWIAPVKADDIYKYTWMMGWSNDIALNAQCWFRDRRDITKFDPLLLQEYITPELLFVDTHKVSKTSFDEFAYEDEFAIFQLGYKDAPVEVGDFDQRMVINTSFAVRKRLSALQNLNFICSTDRNTDIILCIKANLELFSVLHSEGHNQGHFVGAWPLLDKVKKKAVIYEAVEEFKACLASVIFVEHMPIIEQEKTAFAVCVFMSRFLGYGYDAYKLMNHRRETVREITVGLMFFEWLVHDNVIHVCESGKIDFSADKLRISLMRAYQQIFNQENNVKERSYEELNAIAIYWYRMAFPNQDYSRHAKMVYNALG